MALWEKRIRGIAAISQEHHPDLEKLGCLYHGTKLGFTTRHYSHMGRPGRCLSLSCINLLLGAEVKWPDRKHQHLDKTWDLLFDIDRLLGRERECPCARWTREPVRSRGGCERHKRAAEFKSLPSSAPPRQRRQGMLCHAWVLFCARPDEYTVTDTRPCSVRRTSWDI